MFASVCLLTLFAQGPVQGTRQPVITEPARSFITIEGAGLDALFVDPKDQALSEVLGLTGARLRDLPTELKGVPVPPNVVPLALRVFGGPFRISMGFAPAGDPANPLGVAIDARLHKANQEEAAAVGTDLVRFLTGFGLGFGEADSDGLQRAQFPFPVWLGPNGGDLVVRAGGEGGVAYTSAAELLPRGTRFAFGEQVDVGAGIELLPLLMRNEGEDDIAEVMGIVRAFGLDRMKIAVALGTDASSTRMVERVDGLETVLAQAGFLDDSSLDAGFVRFVPEDATWAKLFAMNLLQPFDRLITFVEDKDPGALEDLAEFEAELGVSLRDDILAPLSGRFAMYGSDSTGGGMTSTVLIAELADPDTMAQTLTAIESLVNAKAQEEAKGYVRFVQAEDKGVRFDTLRFPGLPVPSEVTFAIVGKDLVIALNPQAARAAVDQMLNGGSSLLNAPGFTAGLDGASVDGSYVLAWLDTPDLMTAGYGSVGLLTAALSNVVRSPADPNRGPAFVLPTFGDLSRGAMPMVSLTTLEDGALVTRTRCDRSQLVNLTGMAGALFRSPMGLYMLLNGGLQAAMENGWEPDLDFGEAESGEDGESPFEYKVF